MTHEAIGQRFGRLIVLAVEPQSWPDKPIAVCRCDCGTVSRPRLNNLHYGSTRSCGCIRAEEGRRKLAALRQSA